MVHYLRGYPFRLSGKLKPITIVTKVYFSEYFIISLSETLSTEIYDMKKFITSFKTKLAFNRNTRGLNAKK